MEMSTINFLTAQARMGLMRPNPYVQLCPDTGLWQIGLVRHDDGNPSDEFCCALTITGVDSCGNVHFPPRSKAFGRALLKVDENLIIKIVIPSNG
jgi:hypothetical protein